MTLFRWIADETVLPGWGDPAGRGMLWEAVCANSYMQAGADILVMAHPKAIECIRTTLEKM